MYHTIFQCQNTCGRQLIAKASKIIGFAWNIVLRTKTYKICEYDFCEVSESEVKQMFVLYRYNLRQNVFNYSENKLRFNVHQAIVLRLFCCENDCLLLFKNKEIFSCLSLHGLCRYPRVYILSEFSDRPHNVFSLRKGILRNSAASFCFLQYFCSVLPRWKERFLKVGIMQKCVKINFNLRRRIFSEAIRSWTTS